MTDCTCGHAAIGHSDGTGRCLGECYDGELDTIYRCLCHAYRAPAMTVAEQLDAAETGEQWGTVVLGLLSALEKGL